MPNVVTYENVDSGIAYNMAHGDPNIKDGTVIVIPHDGLVVIMNKAWPVLIPEAEPFQKEKVFQTLASGYSFDTLDDGFYSDSYKLAKVEFAKLRE